MTFIVAVLILVISETRSARLLFPLQSFSSVAMPGTQSLLPSKHKDQSQTGVALTSCNLNSKYVLSAPLLMKDLCFPLHAAVTRTLSFPIKLSFAHKIKANIFNFSSMFSQFSPYPKDTTLM